MTRLKEFSPNGRLLPLGSFFEKYRSSRNLRATLPHGKISVLIVTNKHLGDFFTNSSCHPGCMAVPFLCRKKVYCIGVMLAQS
jgi:hypothetical protein